MSPSQIPLLAPSARAGLMSGILGCVFLAVNEVLFFDFAPKFIAGLLLAALPLVFPSYFLGAFVLSILLLLPLRILFVHTSKSISLSIFVFVGFSVAALISICIALVSHHGQNPSTVTDVAHKIFTTTSFGIMGGASAYICWRFLRKWTVNAT